VGCAGHIDLNRNVFCILNTEFNIGSQPACQAKKRAVALIKKCKAIATGR
jgi:hypothetical protein